MLTRLAADGSCIEVWVSCGTATAALLEEMGLCDVLRQEPGGTVVLATDDPDGIRRALASLRTAH
jgi:hypothetical protein